MHRGDGSGDASATAIDALDHLTGANTLDGHRVPAFRPVQHKLATDPHLGGAVGIEEKNRWAHRDEKASFKRPRRLPLSALVRVDTACVVFSPRISANSRSNSD